MQARMHDDGGVAEPVPEIGVVGHDEAEHLLGTVGAHDELAQHAGIQLLEEFVVARRRAPEAPLNVTSGSLESRYSGAWSSFVSILRWRRRV